jgi:hypothetical protein
MKIEFLKLKFSPIFWLITVVFILLNLYFILNFNQPTTLVGESISLSFNNINDRNLFPIVFFNSFIAYTSIIYLSFVSFVIFETDNHVLKNDLYNNFKTSSTLILANKVIFILSIQAIIYLIFLIFIILTTIKVNYNAFSIILPLIILLGVKYFINTFIMISILIIFQYLLKNNWSYFLFVILNIAGLTFINQQYSIYSWYINSLAYVTIVLRNNIVHLTYDSEYLLISLFFILIFIFIYFETTKYKQIRP